MTVTVTVTVTTRVSARACAAAHSEAGLQAATSDTFVTDTCGIAAGGGSRRRLLVHLRDQSWVAMDASAAGGSFRSRHYCYCRGRTNDEEDREPVADHRALGPRAILAEDGLAEHVAHLRDFDPPGDLVGPLLRIIRCRPRQQRCSLATASCSGLAVCSQHLDGVCRGVKAAAGDKMRNGGGGGGK